MAEVGFFQIAGTETGEDHHQHGNCALGGFDGDRRGDRGKDGGDNVYGKPYAEESRQGDGQGPEIPAPYLYGEEFPVFYI
ncbi:hypothetical protein AGMMS49991_02310 [Spirochaetia bacterium]|nr:hypothetical protein AGMMS49991_02310 [Spirochaetia bacterium]